MTYRNTLCVDNRCNTPAGCAHRGKLGQFCDFTVEQKLCELLEIAWTPQYELDSLLSMVKDKLAMLPAEDDYAAQVKLATRFAATKNVPVLSSHDEEKDTHDGKSSANSSSN